MVKGKAAAAVMRVPQNRDEARAMIADYGAKLREVERIEADMNDALAAVKQSHLAKATPIADQANDLLKGLQIWCEANRVELTQNGKSKTVDFGTGKVAWRWNPPKVRISGGDDVVVARIQDKGANYAAFLRTKLELNRDAMLANPDLARTVDGVSIGRGNESFIVEPFAAEQLADVTS
ncbi:host-nuclease inhibitor Gam family protein [Rhodopseudomonas palustris]|uniref:Host-nuclease inhibitor protein Gam n=1 Tax=Rhodopseudomonas palustris TaxID=1076 RepID=A0A418V4C1_RHOPL|nr:host-nuclease inhibitor Gam family protein [Rhodopseudomonas palustris]RJF70897.1 host-nuclease inhibitor protein Gam [Rhodopseudomonas palustris]